MRRLASVVLAALVCLACGPNAAPDDAGQDADVDASRDAATVDSGRCDMTCMPGRACCRVDGVDTCIDLSTDVDNCGSCGRDCVALRRGDTCVDFQCSCGAAEIGCTGAENSICCPPTHAGGQSYCANPGRDPSDCGRCGFHCIPERANQCEGGMCTCGLSGAECAGTPEDQCCTRDAEDYHCVDTTTDDDHCGFCGNRCNAFEDCQAGHCVSTLPDAGLTDAGSPDAG